MYFAFYSVKKRLHDFSTFVLTQSSALRLPHARLFKDKFP